MAAKAIAIIAGVGAGTGASVARHFSSSYPVVLLARNADHFKTLAEEINKSGGNAIGISTDLTDPASLKNAFERIQEEFPGVPCAAAIYNAAGGFVRKPLLEVTEEEFTHGFAVNVYVAQAKS
jgi:NADP-dependent 3-hydroxy acid dehydrogenase YdfG